MASGTEKQIFDQVLWSFDRPFGPSATKVSAVRAASHAVSDISRSPVTSKRRKLVDTCKRAPLNQYGFGRVAGLLAASFDFAA